MSVVTTSPSPEVLNRAKFVSSFTSGDYAYFLFQEIDYIFSDASTGSSVTKVSYSILLFIVPFLPNVTHILVRFVGLAVNTMKLNQKGNMWRDIRHTVWLLLCLQIGLKSKSPNYIHIVKKSILNRDDNHINLLTSKFRLCHELLESVKKTRVSFTMLSISRVPTEFGKLL